MKSNWVSSHAEGFDNGKWRRAQEKQSVVRCGVRSRLHLHYCPDQEISRSLVKKWAPSLGSVVPCGRHVAGKMAIVMVIILESITDSGSSALSFPSREYLT